MADIHSEELDNLFKAILKLKSVDECYNFFTDLCTVQEIMAMKQRFSVVTLLDKGIKFSDIEEMTGASSATISRVNKCLKYGEGGYEAILALLNKNGNKQ